MTVREAPYRRGRHALVRDIGYDDLSGSRQLDAIVKSPPRRAARQVCTSQPGTRGNASGITHLDVAGQLHRARTAVGEACDGEHGALDGERNLPAVPASRVWCGHQSRGIACTLPARSITGRQSTMNGRQAARVGQSAARSSRAAAPVGAARPSAPSPHRGCDAPTAGQWPLAPRHRGLRLAAWAPDQAGQTSTRHQSTSTGAA